MHAFNLATILLTLILVGVEFSVSAFINPAAWRLPVEAQKDLLARLALVLGKVMPVWYPATGLMLVAQTWLHWHTAARTPLLASAILWIAASLASILFLVPLNTRIAQGAADWQQLHHTWDSRHRIRIATLATAAALLVHALVP